MRNFVFILLTFLIITSIKAQEIIDSSIVVLQKIIYFDTDKYQLTAAHKDSISSLLNKSEDLPNAKWVVHAHTDKIGSSEYNIKLSQKRQASVSQFLLNNGILDSLIDASFHGEFIPQSKSDDHMNRRAFVQLVTPKKYLYLKGRVTDQDTKLGLRAKIELEGLGFTNIEMTDTLGNFKILAPLDEKVQLAISANGYFFDTNRLLVSERHKDILLKIPLPKIELGRRYLFKNLNFYGNKSILLPGNEWQIKQMIRFMELNPDVCIEISGHINRPNSDSVKVESSNFQLSVARAQEIQIQLMAAGIQSSRMLARGYGNWEMKYPEAFNPEQEQENRRAEIEIIECVVLKNNNDHEISDLERYKHEIMDRKYDETLFYSDLKDYRKEIRITIGRQVELMKAKGMKPERFTYREILVAFPKLPEPEL